MIGRLSIANVLDALRSDGEVSAADAVKAGEILDKAPPGTPWYARVLAGASAWMSAAFILCSVTCLNLDLTALFPFIGAALIVASIVARRLIEASRGGQPVWDFAIQAALIGTLVGRGLIIFGLEENGMDDGVLALLMCAVEVAIIATYPDRLQGFGATIFALSWMWVWLNDMGLPEYALAVPAAGLGCGLLWMRRSLQSNRFDRDSMRPVGFAALAFALCTGTPEAAEHLLSSLALVCIAVLLVAGVTWDHVRDGARARIWVGVATVALLGLVTVSSPGLSLSVALAVLAFHRRDVLLFGCTTIALAISLTWFYYDLDLGLSAKGFLLIGTGVALWLMSMVPGALSGRREVAP